MSDFEPWGDETAEPWIPDPTGEEYVDYHERIVALREDGHERVEPDEEPSDWRERQKP